MRLKAFAISCNPVPLLCMLWQPLGGAVADDTKFRLHQFNSTHVCLESALPLEAGRHIGILANGQIKSPVATGREVNSHFGVRVIVSITLLPTTFGLSQMKYYGWLRCYVYTC